MEENANKASSAIKFGWIKGVLVGIPTQVMKEGLPVLIRGVPSPSSERWEEEILIWRIPNSSNERGGGLSSGVYLAQVVKGGDT